MNNFEPRHGLLTGIIDESMSWKEFFQIVIFVGIPFSLVFAIVFTLITH